MKRFTNTISTEVLPEEVEVAQEAVEVIPEVALEVVEVILEVVQEVEEVVQEVVVVVMVAEMHKLLSQSTLSSQNTKAQLLLLIHYKKLKNLLLRKRRIENQKILINWLEDLDMVLLVSKQKLVQTI